MKCLWKRVPTGSIMFIVALRAVKISSVIRFSFNGGSIKATIAPTVSAARVLAFPIAVHKDKKT